MLSLVSRNPLPQLPGIMNKTACIVSLNNNCSTFPRTHYIPSLSPISSYADEDAGNSPGRAIISLR